MEQSVWLYFGIIAVILCIGIITQLVYWNTQQSYTTVIEGALKKLSAECNLVSSSTSGTLLGIDVELPSGSVVSAANSKICIKFKEKNICKNCKCKLASYLLDLNTSTAKEMFDIHTYNCYFEKTSDSCVMECKG